jgi:hypothetical protein
VDCSDGVLVDLSRRVPDSFSVSIETRDFVATQEFPNGLAVNWVFFENLTPADGTVRVSWATAVIETTLAFAYQASRPNGAGCDPVCRQAIVEVDLP